MVSNTKGLQWVFLVYPYSYSLYRNGTCEVSCTSWCALLLMNSLTVVKVHMGNKTYQLLKAVPFLLEPCTLWCEWISQSSELSLLQGIKLARWLGISDFMLVCINDFWVWNYDHVLLLPFILCPCVFNQWSIFISEGEM